MQLSKFQKIPPKTILLFVVSAVIFFILLTAVINLGKKYFGLKEKLTDLVQQKSALEQKKQDLSVENSYLGTAEGEEHLLREKYRLVKPGEGLIVVTDTPENQLLVEKKTTSLGKFWDSILRGLGIRD